MILKIISETAPFLLQFKYYNNKIYVKHDKTLGGL